MQQEDGRLKINDKKMSRLLRQSSLINYWIMKLDKMKKGNMGYKVTSIYGLSNGVYIIEPLRTDVFG